MKTLLTDIFNYDFSGGDVSGRFFAHALTLADLKKICAFVCSSHAEIDGKTIPAAIRIKGKGTELPFTILAQLHGNEPAGLAGIALAMALSQAGKLERDVIGVIGNPVAAQQYFAVWEKAPQNRQETRDMYRGGIDGKGNLLPDMNRIPVDFLSRDIADPHIKRAHELYALAQQVSGITDIHSARGNLLCFTDHKYDGELKDSPVRNILTGLADAISVHASANVTVHTWKTILAPLPNLKSHTGIEAGRHESPETPHTAASFTLSLLHTLGITKVAPIHTKENGLFERYAVRPRITYGDLKHEDTIESRDCIYMAARCNALASVPERSDTVIVRQADGRYTLQSVAEFAKKPAGRMEYAVYQYDEMEAVAKEQTVAVAVPSGTALRAPFAFSCLFVSKSAALYDKDPSVGPWPVAAGDLERIKFCYPCDVSEMRITFDKN